MGAIRTSPGSYLYMFNAGLSKQSSDAHAYNMYVSYGAWQKTSGVF